MTRILPFAVRVAVATLITAPVFAQAPHFSIESEPGRVYEAMNLNPPGVTGRIYNDGTTEVPPAAPATEAR